jgi:hypothetical protein
LVNSHFLQHHRWNLNDWIQSKCWWWRWMPRFGLQWRNNNCWFDLCFDNLLGYPRFWSLHVVSQFLANKKATNIHKPKNDLNLYTNVVGLAWAHEVASLVTRHCDTTCKNQTVDNQASCQSKGQPNNCYSSTEDQTVASISTTNT